MSYVSIDIETTGLNPDNCQIIQFGAVIDNGKPFDELPRFKRNIRHRNYTGEAYALGMHSDLLKCLASGGGELESDVVDDFLKFLQDNNVSRIEPFTVAGKNYANFDARFLRKIAAWNLLVKTKHRVIDPGNLFWNPEVDGDALPNTKTCMERAGISGEVAHTALADAEVVVRLVRAHKQNLININHARNLWMEANDVPRP